MKQPDTSTLCRALAASLLFVTSPRAFGQTPADIAPITPERIKTIPGHGMSQAEYPFNEAGRYETSWVTTEAKSKVSKSTTVQKPIPYDSPEHPRNGRNQKNSPPPAPDPTPAKESIPEPPLKFTESEKAEKLEKWDKPEKTEPSLVIATDSEAIKAGFFGPFEKMTISRVDDGKIPTSAPAIVKTSLPTPPKSPTSSVATASLAEPIYHKVSAGDTLFAISKRYGITVDAIKRSNGLTNDMIKVGQTLRLALAQHALGSIVN